LRRYRFAFPPLAEQCEIASALAAKTEELTKLCGEAKRAIGLLRERRAALITAAVTGQIDVRGTVPSSGIEEELAA
jgi:type I restriction enzyme S subunit